MDCFYGANAVPVGQISDEIYRFPCSYNGKVNFGSQIGSKSW